MNVVSQPGWVRERDRFCGSPESFKVLTCSEMGVIGKFRMGFAAVMDSIGTDCRGTRADIHSRTASDTHFFVKKINA